MSLAPDSTAARISEVDQANDRSGARGALQVARPTRTVHAELARNCRDQVLHVIGVVQLEHLLHGLYRGHGGFDAATSLEAEVVHGVEVERVCHCDLDRSVADP